MPPACFLIDVCLFAILGIPGLLCRSEQSSAFVCSFTGPARSGTLLARSGTLLHAPDTRLARAMARHVGYDIASRHTSRLLASFVDGYVGVALQAYPGGKPLLPISTHLPGIVMPVWVCRFSYVG